MKPHELYRIRERKKSRKMYRRFLKLGYRLLFETTDGHGGTILYGFTKGGRK
jgi:hypothetical protein